MKPNQDQDSEEEKYQTTLLEKDAKENLLTLYIQYTNMKPTSSHHNHVILNPLYIIAVED